jgi:hypothetical protein
MRRDARDGARHVAGALALAAVLGLGLGLGGCASMFEVKVLDGQLSADPLPPGELRTRFEVRLQAGEFAERVALAADRIADLATERAVRTAALRWKIGAVSAVTGAGLRQPGQHALVDTWALALQMEQLVTEGGARDAFGAQQPIAVDTARALARDLEALAGRLLDPPALAAYRTLVVEHAASAPIADLGFARAPIAGDWLRVAQTVGGVPKTLGAASEVLADATDRSDTYARRLPESLRWRGELALKGQEERLAGLGRSFESIDREIAQIGRLAREQPDRAWNELERIRGDLAAVLAVTDRRWAESLGQLREERVALGHALEETRIVLDATIERERQALAGAFDVQRAQITEAFDRQRAALTADGERIATELSRLWLERTQSILRDVLVWLSLFLGAIGLGGFGLGFLVARVLRRSAAPPPADPPSRR